MTPLVAAQGLLRLRQVVLVANAALLVLVEPPVTCTEQTVRHDCLELTSRVFKAKPDIYKM